MIINQWVYGYTIFRHTHIISISCLTAVGCCPFKYFEVLITALGTRTACRVPGLRPPDTCHDPTIDRLIPGKLPSHSRRVFPMVFPWFSMIFPCFSHVFAMFFHDFPMFFPCFSMLQTIFPSTRPFPQLGLLYSPSTWSNRAFPNGVASVQGSQT